MSGIDTITTTMEILMSRMVILTPSSLYTLVLAMNPARPPAMTGLSGATPGMHSRIARVLMDRVQTYFLMAVSGSAAAIIGLASTLSSLKTVAWVSLLMNTAMTWACRIFTIP